MFDVCLLAAHPGPANHFVEYAQVLEENRVRYCVIASAKEAPKFRNAGLKVTVIEETPDILTITAKARTVIIDSSQSEHAAKLKDCSQGTRRILYYDNPYPYVP